MTEDATRGAEIETGDDDGWVNSSRITYKYEYGTLTEKLSYRWNSGEWTTNSGQIIDYDFDVTSSDAYFPEGWTDPYKINVLDDVYGDGSNGWLVYRRSYYYSENTPTSITGVAGEADGVKVWPTLVTEGFTVDAPEGSRVNVFNAGGARVKTASAGYINATDLPSGMYIVTVNGSRTKIVKK